MEILNWLLRPLLARLRDPARWESYGHIVNTLLFASLCMGVFCLLFAAFGLAIARFFGETPTDWAFDGIMVGAAVAPILLVSNAFVEFEPSRSTKS